MLSTLEDTSTWLKQKKLDVLKVLELCENLLDENAVLKVDNLSLKAANDALQLQVSTAVSELENCREELNTMKQHFGLENHIEDCFSTPLIIKPDPDAEQESISTSADESLPCHSLNFISVAQYSAEADDICNNASSSNISSYDEAEYHLPVSMESQYAIAPEPVIVGHHRPDIISPNKGKVNPKGGNTLSNVVHQVLPTTSCTRRTQTISTIRKLPKPTGTSLSSNHKKQVQCQYCPKTFRCRWEVLRHNIVHSRERPHQCNYCGQTFGLASNRDKHIRTQHKDQQTVSTYAFHHRR